MVLFLNSNAHVPLNQKALDSFIKYNQSIAGHGNAMGICLPDRQAASELETARRKISELIGAKDPNQIIFTSSCTQACEWGLEILAAQKFSKVYCSTIEHRSVATKARELFGNNDLFANKDGVVACSFTPPENAAFVCIHVQNELGTIQPLESIKVPFFSDMSQSLGKIPLNVSSLPNLKIAVFSAHKFGGPVGVGILYLQDTKWWREFGTGSRYYFDRPGTPDVGMIVAATIALEEAVKTLSKRYERALAFRSTIEMVFNQIGVEIIGVNASRIPHTTFINIGKKMAPYVMSQLEAEGIFVGLGSACGSLHSNTNPVMTALGYGGSSQDFLRISQWGDYGELEARFAARAFIKYCPKP